MSKAILVLDDMPKSCEDCELCRDFYLCLRLGEIDESARENGTRDLRCPLKPLPEKKKEFEEKINHNDDFYEKGWNDCLDEILMGNE